MYGSNEKVMCLLEDGVVRVAFADQRGNFAAQRRGQSHQHFEAGHMRVLS